MPVRAGTKRTASPTRPTVGTAVFPTSGLVAYWDLNGNSTDHKGVSSGTDTAISYSAANGKISQGAGFNGATSKIVVSTIASSPFRQATAITYSFWAKFPAASGGSTLMGTAVTGGQGSGGVAVNQVGSLFFFWTPTVPNSDTTWSATVAAIDANWHHYAFTMTFAGATVGQWYMDGVAQTTTRSQSVTNGTPIITYNTANGDSLGSRYVVSRSFGNASLDEIGLWSVALSGANITALYNNGFGLPYIGG